MYNEMYNSLYVELGPRGPQRPRGRTAASQCCPCDSAPRPAPPRHPAPPSPACRLRVPSLRFMMPTGPYVRVALSTVSHLPLFDPLLARYRPASRSVRNACPTTPLVSLVQRFLLTKCVPHLGCDSHCDVWSAIACSGAAPATPPSSSRRKSPRSRQRRTYVTSAALCLSSWCAV